LDAVGICVGCFRSIDEIKAWSDANDKTRQVFLDNAKQRQKMQNKIKCGDF